ncbi:MAG: MBOAT family protein [Lachnospiraceae bacterium]|nr:MBOAT family protein [Lachnospiraceae bacterium]
MTFSSTPFLFMFLPVTFLLYAVIRNQIARNVILIMASLVFYAYGEPVAVIIMIISIILNYIFGRIASTDKRDKLAVFLAVLLNIGLLVAYKYTGFFVSIFNDVTGMNVAVPDIRLPIGISFFTFQGLSYVIDVYRNKSSVQKNLFSVMLYISFFPQLIAGPIVRYEDIASQLKVREFSIDRISRGLNRFCFGLGKKVLIANQMGYVADTVFSYDPSNVGTLPAWIGAFCYTLQIFFDFSGYSDMAIGLGCVFGFDFKENFNYPFISPSIQEFWRRWHISLSTWFKEYVYIPLGGNRKGNLRTVFNKLFVFFLTGFWHGANFTFIVWGMIHGICLMLETYQIVPTKKKWFKYVGHVYTMLVVVLAFVIFRADSLTQGFGIIKDMFTFNEGVHSANVAVMACISQLFVITFIFAILLSAPICRYIRGKVEAKGDVKVYNYLSYTGSFVIFIMSVLTLISSSYNPFIYFRF